MRRLRVPFALFWCVAAGLQAQELDHPLRAVHLSGNWGTPPMPSISGRWIEPSR